MKYLISTTLLLLSLTSTNAAAQTTTFQYVGAGCGPTVGYPWIDGAGNLKFTAADQYAGVWACNGGHR